MKRSPLQRRTPLQSHSTLTRTPMNRTRKSKAAKAREFTPKVREAIYDRSAGICEMCKSRPAVHIHHVEYRSQGGTGEISNGLHVCAWCHERAHASRETRLLAVRLAHRLAGINVDDNTDNLVSTAEFIG